MNQGVPSMLSPAGAGAHLIAPLAWVLIVAASLACVIVIVLVLGGTRRRGSLASHAPVDAGGGTVWIQLGGLIIPVVVLTATFILSESILGKLSSGAHAATRATSNSASLDTSMTIDVTARQWWWQVRYRSPDGMRTFATANEIHLPIGRSVRIVLRSDDVNHSFWVPQLHPKEDAIPGELHRLIVQADRPGTFRGECSEFCGQEHARMAFTVIAETPEQYAAWLARESADADSAFADSLARRGRMAFLENACAFCHAVRGTMAQGVVAPDLTHLASRPKLAAGTLANTRTNLAGWIMNAPAIKPGTQMPSFPQLDAATLRALIAYLENLR